MFIQGVRALCSDLFFCVVVHAMDFSPVDPNLPWISPNDLLMYVLVSGASRGVGRDTALYLAQQGHEIWALSRSAEKLTSLAQSAKDQPGRIHVVVSDLAQAEAIDQSIAQILPHMPHLDVLINNAGLLIHQPFEQLTDEAWLAMWQVNVMGAVRLIRALLPKLQQAPRAHVVQIGSMGGFQGSAKFPGLSAYSASKAALASLSECLAEEFKEQGIAFNTLALGAVQTEMLAQAFPGYQAPVRSEEMGAFVGWFALHGHRYFNGKVLPVSVSTP